MKFPTITHIDQIHEEIKNRPEFYIAERPGYFVCNYMVSEPESFGRGELTESDLIRRECRGIIFDTNGNIIRRPYHKFFNLGEKEETFPQNVDLSKPHVILEKLDGSMIAPFMVDDNLIWGSKMGYTEMTKPVHEFVNKNRNYQKLAEFFIAAGFTPIFEWCSRKQRIVIDYPEDILILTGIRHMKTGEYYPYSNLKSDFKEYMDIPVVKAYEGTVENIQALEEHTRGLQGMEGFVIRFDDGQMIKIKADEYVRIHRAKDSIILEKHVLDLIFNEQIDDVIPHLLKDDAEKLIGFQRKILHAVDSEVLTIYFDINWCKEQYPTKKEYALNYVKARPELWWQHPIAFKVYDADFTVADIRIELISFIKKNISSATKIDGIAKIWGVRWNYGE